MFIVAIAPWGKAASWCSFTSLIPHDQQLPAPASGRNLRNASLAEEGLTSMEDFIFN